MRSQRTELTCLSLFSGIGGIELAAERAGFQTVGFCEKDPACRQVLAKHWPDVPIWKDVRDVTAESFRKRTGLDRPTIVTGGFPCQPFSSAGKRRGTNDERHLWPEFARDVRELRPRWVVGENVRGLLSIGDGSVFGSVLADLADLGYRAGWACYGADEAAEATHRRDRVFIVGYLAEPGHGGGRQLGTVGEGSHGEAGRPTCASAPDGSGAELADTGSVGCQRCRRRTNQTRWGFPPGPGDIDRWREVLEVRPDLAPALTKKDETELEICGVANGVPRGLAKLTLSRRARLKMLGNAVVPAQVEPILQWIARFERNIK